MPLHDFIIQTIKKHQTPAHLGLQHQSRTLPRGQETYEITEHLTNSVAQFCIFGEKNETQQEENHITSNTGSTAGFAPL